MSTQYRFDEPALNIAQKIMECRATAAAEGWPDVRLTAAIQCLVIEAMKWAAPAAPVAFIDGNVSDEAMQQLLAELKSSGTNGGIMVRPPAVPEGWRLVPFEPTKEMISGMAGWREYEALNDELPSDVLILCQIYRAALENSPAPGGEHGL
jgi:hypothetical protein